MNDLMIKMAENVVVDQNWLEDQLQSALREQIQVQTCEQIDTIESLNQHYWIWENSLLPHSNTVT